MSDDISSEKIENRYNELDSDAKRSGYFLNPDVFFTKGLVEGLLKNAERYGYESCPCRLSFSEKQDDLDIICPCDYRDEDINEFGACYCGLYLSELSIKKGNPAPVVPERRLPLKDRIKQSQFSSLSGPLPFPVFRCKVCGYLCARNNPPEKCPICKAEKTRFELFLK